MMADEAQNLKKYADCGCEKAFEALVRKHAGMVFGTAFRRSGDRQTAEEISQNVFTTLARKAPRLHGDGSLAGWLHRTTLLQTANFLRKQQRQDKKMKAFAEHQESTAMGDPVAHEILEILDEAIDKLSKRDRKVILMRFFEGLSIREIAAVTGKSEAASQKQSHRALQKLSNLLKTSGGAVPAGVLTSQIIPVTSEAVGDGLVASLSRSALSGAASVPPSTSGSTILMAGGLATAAVAVAVVAILLSLSKKEEDISQSAPEKNRSGKMAENEMASSMPSAMDKRAKTGSPRPSSKPPRVFLPPKRQGASTAPPKEDPFGPSADF